MNNRYGPSTVALIACQHLLVSVGC